MRNSKLCPLLRECLAVPSAEGQDLAESILSRNGYAVKREHSGVWGDGFCYAEGTVPVLLVAHTDTVYDRSPGTVYHDPRKQVIWSPGGLGADDRIGVYIIARLLRDGLRPHVLLTDGEETGGAGARNAADLLSPDVRALIQLDRAGANDAVYYHCDSPDLRRWVDGFGWRTAIGSYTDICELMEPWGVAGVNLSVGYYGQHTGAEHVRLNETERTIRRVVAMLRRPPKRLIPYQTFPRPTERDSTLALDMDVFPWDGYGRDR